jgi:ArsR family transcriptional regulator, arsenate/arsenite/antimonite-responsive transcriptional repressor
LKIVALLAKEQSGLPAGEIASRLGIGKSTLSAQLRMLADARLLDSDRKGRHIIYSCDHDGVVSCISNFLLIIDSGTASRIRHAMQKQ